MSSELVLKTLRVRVEDPMDAKTVSKKTVSVENRNCTAEREKVSFFLQLIRRIIPKPNKIRSLFIVQRNRCAGKSMYPQQNEGKKIVVR